MGTPASFEDISKWFDEGRAKQATHMIVKSDHRSGTNYPIFAQNLEDLRKKMDQNLTMWCGIEEVYSMKMPKAQQMAETRAWHPN